MFARSNLEEQDLPAHRQAFGLAGCAYRRQKPEEVYLEDNLYVLELAVNDLLDTKDLAGKCDSTLIRVGPQGGRDMVRRGEGRIHSGSVAGVRHGIYISDKSIDPVARKAVGLT